MATADGYVLPKPAIPKTLGILNIIFAVLLILAGLCIGGFTLLLPAIQQLGQKAVDQQKTQAETRKAADLKLLDDRTQAATTDEEKAVIAKERDEVANRAAPATINPTMGTAVLKDPKVMGFLVSQVVTGLILHITLLVAGIGLVRLTPWGRTLGLWWAGLQIVQLVILGVINFMMILPITQQYTDATIADLKKQAAGPNPPPTAQMTIQTTEMSAKLAPVLAGAQLLAGLTYPVICLILLGTAGAKAACLARSSAKPPTTDF